MRNEFESPLIKRYASKEMSFIFSPQHKFETWRKLWIYLAESEMELGLPITQEQVDALEANVDNIDFAVAEARGVIILAAKQKGVKVNEYTPLQVKQAVTGYGKAEKHQVMEMVKSLLSLNKVPKPDDTADALAIAICHGHYSDSVLRR